MRSLWQGKPAGRLAGYLQETTRPLPCLVFVLPLLVAYEGGLLLWPQAMRNGADVWLRRLLELIGFGQYFLLPLLTCGILLAWHHVRQDRWRVRGGVLYGMLLESLGLGFFLLLLAQLQGAWFNHWSAGWTAAMGGSDGVAARVSAFFGAGIYEELLFRLMLLPLLAAALRALGVSRRASLVTAVVLAGLLFAAAHYRLDLALGPWHLATSYGDAFQWTSFLFRFSAGVFFSLVFLYRGFAIAVGSHAVYDILVSCF